LERVLENRRDLLEGRLGLISNQASVDRRFRHAADLLHASPGVRLAALFGPQHGIRGDVQDNMIETGHAVDALTGLPVFSLYSETREPTDEMLAHVDALVFDLQDVGCRVYTFVYTMANSMIAAARTGKRFVVLDRPNPIGGTLIEGNLLEKGHESFVGMYPVPMRHGMTVGELARMFNEEFGIGCDLEVVAMEGWRRDEYIDETDAPWVMPSPNMPTADTAAVFPGTVFFEGTGVSEGRGTTRPFEIVGAGFVDQDAFARALAALGIPGAVFRPVRFLPTFQKEAGKACGGVFVHVTDRNAFEPVFAGLAMIKTLFDLYPDGFAWKTPPYEYVYDRNPFDVICGTAAVRELFERGGGFGELRDLCRGAIGDFARTREPYLLY
jgi:uncharacterized protein YbbC (DUF1343 family)